MFVHGKFFKDSLIFACKLVAFTLKIFSFRLGSLKNLQYTNALAYLHIINDVIDGGQNNLECLYMASFYKDSLTSLVTELGIHSDGLLRNIR